MTALRPDRPDLVTTVDLVRRAQAGDEASLNEIFERYYPRVQRVVEMMVGRKLQAFYGPEDLLQDVFAAALAEFDEFRMMTSSSLLRWLTQIAVHKVRTRAEYMNARKRDPSRQVPLAHIVGLAGTGERPLEPENPGAGPATRAAEEDEMRVLDECIAELSEEQRNLILYRAFVGGSWQEVGSWLGGIAPNTARMQYSRALARLTALVQSSGPAGEGPA